MKPRVLFVAAEALPLAKTGGLGDVVASLAAALQSRGIDMTVLLPGYPSAIDAAVQWRQAGTLPARGAVPGGRLLAGRMPDTDVGVALVDIDALYDRPGSLYLDERGVDHADNALRFAALSHAAVAIAAGDTRLAPPHVVHAHDWHAGLTPLLLKAAGLTTPSAITLHNLAFQGVFPLDTASALGLPTNPAAMDALEYWGQLSFLKAGIASADRITTVSPTYAREILTPAFGHGLDGVLRSRQQLLSAVCNGIDAVVWNPATDSSIAKTYGVDDMRGKAVCKRALQHHFGLQAQPFAPILALGSRITEQKMADVALVALEQALGVHERLQVAVLGKGDAALEDGFRALAARWPGRVGVEIGYTEPLAHMLHAGADMLLHGSRFEPFGLTPVYAMRYGTVPIVSAVGGLVDTVTDCTDASPDADPLSVGTAMTGFTLTGDSPTAMVDAIGRALQLFAAPARWRQLQRNGMGADFSWSRLADQYIDLYADMVLTAADPLATAAFRALRAFQGMQRPGHDDQPSCTAPGSDSGASAQLA